MVCLHSPLLTKVGNLRLSSTADIFELSPLRDETRRSRDLGTAWFPRIMYASSLGG